MNNPIYNPMPVYEQILPRNIPQTTVIDETKANTQPGLDASTSKCDDHHVNHLSRSENCYIDQPTHVQNGLQLVDTTKTFVHSGPIGQNVNDTFFAEASTMTKSMSSSFHPALTLDTNDDNKFPTFIDGKEGTRAVLASATQIKQEAEVMDKDNSDWVLGCSVIVSEHCTELTNCQN